MAKSTGRSAIWLCLAPAIVAVALVIAGPLLRYEAAVRRRETGFASAVLPTMFDVNTESNVPSWFSASLWLACAFVAAVIAWLIGRAIWSALAAACVLFSLDEAAGLHEVFLGHAGDGLLGKDGVLHFTWVVPGAILGLGVALVFGSLVWSLPRWQRVGVLASGALFVLGSIGMETVSGWVLQRSGNAVGYVLATSAEEGAEMLAVIGFLAVLLSLVDVRRTDAGLQVNADDRLRRAPKRASETPPPGAAPPDTAPPDTAPPLTARPE